MRELWLPEERVFEKFFSAFPVKIPAKPEMLPANRELLIIPEVIFFLKDPNL
jgi:hypothetical protein